MANETLADFMADYDAELIAQAKAEIAREDAFNATPEGQRKLAERTARFHATLDAAIAIGAELEPTACDMCGDDLDDGECPSCDA